MKKQALLVVLAVFGVLGFLVAAILAVGHRGEEEQAAAAASSIAEVQARTVARDKYLAEHPTLSEETAHAMRRGELARGMNKDQAELTIGKLSLQSERVLGSGRYETYARREDGRIVVLSFRDSMLDGWEKR